MAVDPKALAEAVRRACLTAALEAHEDAGFAGLCESGRWDRAIDAIRDLDLSSIVIRETDR